MAASLALDVPTGRKTSISGWDAPHRAERPSEVSIGDDASQIRTLIQRWADAVHAGDLLTIGLRKENGRWTVAHEHHSFPYKDS